MIINYIQIKYLKNKKNNDLMFEKILIQNKL